MKLEKKQISINDKIIELIAKTKTYDEQLAKLSVTVNQLAKVIALQKEEALNLKEEIKKEKLDTLNTVKKLIEEVERQLNNIPNIKNNNDFDDKDLDFLANKIKEKLNPKKESILKKFFKILKRIEESNYSILFLLLVIAVIIYLKFDKFKLLISYLKIKIFG